jgi:transcriptional regulator GlxA family with amidase domain
MGLATRSAEIRFRNATGKSIRGAILAARVARAMALLSEPRRDPVSVFVECGWCDEHAFRRAFTQETGLTPLRWRRLHLGK